MAGIKIYRNGFSLTEILISILITSIIMAISIPVMTKVSELKSGTDKNSMDCIAKNAADINYNLTTGSTTMPASGTSCFKAVTECKFNLGKSCDTLIWQAEHGKTTQRQTAAKTILRTTCDQGGETACNWFIKQCIQSTKTSFPYCDDTGYFDITYYLSLSSNNANLGRLYIMDETNKLIKKGVTKILETVIKGCNNSNFTSCTIANKNNYNQTCTQIKNTFESAGLNASNGIYKITPEGAEGNEFNAYCDMATDDRAWVLAAIPSTYTSFFNESLNDKMTPSSSTGTRSLVWNSSSSYPFSQIKVTDESGNYAIANLGSTTSMKSLNTEYPSYSQNNMLTTSVTSNLSLSCFWFRAQSGNNYPFSDSSDWAYMDFSSYCTVPNIKGDSWDYVSSGVTNWVIGGTDNGYDPQTWTNHAVGRTISSSGHWWGYSGWNTKTLVWFR